MNLLLHWNSFFIFVYAHTYFHSHCHSHYIHLCSSLSYFRTLCNQIYTFLVLLLLSVICFQHFKSVRKRFFSSICYFKFICVRRLLLSSFNEECFLFFFLNASRTLYNINNNNICAILLFLFVLILFTCFEIEIYIIYACE